MNQTPCEHHRHTHGHHHHITGRIGFAFWTNFLFAIVELVGGFYVNSVSILSDALHDFGDALTLGFSWYLERKSRQTDNHIYSYGYRRLSTISAVLTSVVLIVGSGWIFIQSLPRLFHPEQPETNGMILLAVLGVVVNGSVIIKMQKGKSLNERVLTWHFVEDLLGWLLILVSAIIMKFVDFPALDPFIAIFISLFIIRNVWRNFQEAMKIFLQATPIDVDLKKIDGYLKSFDEIDDFHHSHLWSLDGESHIFTSHLVLKKSLSSQACADLKTRIKKGLQHTFQIHEATLEIEVHGEPCHDPSHT